MVATVFTILIYLNSTSLAEDVDYFSKPFLGVEKQKAPKAFSKLIKGDIFQHPTTGNRCLENKDCQDASKKKCKNGKAKFDTCSEIYSGSWVTTCVCL